MKWDVYSSLLDIVNNVHTKPIYSIWIYILYFDLNLFVLIS